MMTLVLLFMLYRGFMQEDFIHFGYAIPIYLIIFYLLKDKFTGIKFNKSEVVILTFSKQIVYQLSDFQYIKTISVKKGIYKIIFKHNDSYTFYFRDIKDFIDIFELHNANSHKMGKRIEDKIRGIIPHNPL
ncbi:MAG: hypothetical protein U5N85_15390 [Arcicella sp.]|nr:hypothetical protein [Arcicella sp.]